MSKIKMFALGGLNENGKNMYVVEVDEDIFVFDSGLKHEEGATLGIDYIIPKFDYLIKNRSRIKGLFLTHGHSENMGGVTDIIEKLPEVPVYGTKLTLSIVKQELEEFEILEHNLIEIKPHYKIEFKEDLSIFPISVTHSIPDAVCYVLYTPDGLIVYTGDFVFDATMTGPYKMDIGKLAYVGKQGVLALLSESYYAGKEGFTSPNQRASSFIREVLNQHEHRIIMNILPAHIYRIQEIFDEVSQTHRKIVIMGKNLQDIINNSIMMGYLNIKSDVIGDLNNINDKNTVILVSDSKEHPFANLNRIAKGFDKYIELKETDTVFITESPTLSTEKIVANISDEIAIQNVNVVVLPKSYLLHHPSREDLLLMMNLINPKYYFPVKGEYRYLFENAELAKLYGIPPENILLKENGQVVTLVNGELVEEEEIIEVGDILIDGTIQDDIGALVLKDREAMRENGVIIIAATLNLQKKAIISNVEVVSRGFIYVKENSKMIEEIRDISIQELEKNLQKATTRIDYNQIKNDIRDSLSKHLYKLTESRPMIITVIQEV